MANASMKMDVNVSLAPDRYAVLMEIAGLAVQAEMARYWKAAAKTERNRLQCADEDPATGGVACWKGELVDHGGDIAPEVVHEDWEDWCPTCRSRQAAHDRYMVHGRTLATLRGRLTKRIKKYLADSGIEHEQEGDD